MSRGIKSLTIIGLLAIGLVSCGKKENRFQKIPTPSVDKKTEIVRLDQAVFSLDECITKPAVTGNYDLMTVKIPQNDSLCLEERINKLRDEHGSRFNLYLYQLGAMTGVMQQNAATLFYLFLSHPAYRELYADCEKEYSNMGDIEQQFTDAFARAKALIPGFNTPDVYAMFSGFAEYIAADENTLYVSLEYFLGSDYKNYNYVPGIYEYMIPNLKREKLAPDAVYYWICSEYPLQMETPTLLDNMIYYGKMLYLCEAIFPQLPEELLIGYDKEQWEWCENNETNMWNYLREYNQLFSTDTKTISDYVNQANCTKYFSDETHKAPSKTGVWVGWQIVRKFMEKNEQTDIATLLSANADFILQNSKYRP